MQSSNRPLSSVSIFLLCLLFSLALSFCHTRVQGSSIREERVDSADHAEGISRVIIPEKKTFYCKCLNKEVNNRRTCCQCEKQKCKCWNNWWKNKRKYRGFRNFKRCSHVCGKRKCWKTLLNTADIWRQFLQVKSPWGNQGKGPSSRSYIANEFSRSVAQKG